MDCKLRASALAGPDMFEPMGKWDFSEAEGEFVGTKAEYFSAVQSMSHVQD